jgi:hypothetical protein
MSIFHRAAVEQAYLKAGFFGFAGSGKTVTACLTLAGTILHCRRLGHEQMKKPVFFIDTETGSDFMTPVFEELNIELYVAKTRAFADLVPAIEEAEKEGSAIIIDSVTHHWREFMDSYKRRHKKRFISFEDWDYLKEEWGKFTMAYSNSRVHAALCGRAGYEYEDLIDEDTGKRTIIKTGTKMKTEGEMAFEPSLLVEMTHEQDMTPGAAVPTWNRAFVRKDRWMFLQGATLDFVSKPGEPVMDKVERVWAAFSPHVTRLNLGGEHRGVDTSRTSQSSIPPGGKSEYKRRAEEKEVLMEKIQNLFVTHGISGQSKDGKARIIELLKKHFDTDSWKAIEFHFNVDQVREGWRKLAAELDGTDPLAEVPVEPAS